MTGYDSGDHTSLGAGYTAALLVAASATTWGTMVLHPAQPAAAPPGVEGHVTGPAGAVAGAGVTLSPGNGHAVTSAEGAFHLDVAAGAYTLSVDASGFQPLSQAITVPA